MIFVKNLTKVSKLNNIIGKYVKHPFKKTWLPAPIDDECIDLNKFLKQTEFIKAKIRSTTHISFSRDFGIR